MTIPKATKTDGTTYTLTVENPAGKDQVEVVVHVKGMYRKAQKNLDTRKICYNHPKSLTMWFYLRVMCPNDAEGIANSVDPDQTAPLGAFSRSSLIWVCTVCPDLSVRKLWIIVVDFAKTKDNSLSNFLHL